MPVANKNKTKSGKTSPSGGKGAAKTMAANSEKVKVAAKKPLFSREKSFQSYLYRVLKQVHPEIGISRDSMNTMNSIILSLYTQLSQEASSFSRKTKSQTLSAQDVQAAAKIVLPQELANHAVNDGATAVIKYDNAKK